jgi:hypothetical protein
VRKRKVVYPVARTATRQARPGAGSDPAYVRPTVAAIDLAALNIRTDLSVGDRVRIGGAGLYAGEVAVVEVLTAGVIPAALVRTEAGQRRRARAVDLERLPAESRTPESRTPESATPGS